ncbi:hypothetical protein HanIR_Chr01g0042041 [Helianthus annuus]|nr:hypothetical protein HanIR_Chr01g0042041 [Helianthus annuus]
MNNTAAPAADSGGFLGSQNIGGFGYGIGISFGILLLIITITLASIIVLEVHNHHHHHHTTGGWQSDGHGSAITTQPDSAHCVIDMALMRPPS